MKTFKTLLIASAFIGSSGMAFAECSKGHIASYSEKPTQTAQASSVPAGEQQTSQE